MFIEEFAFAFKLKYIINRCGVLSGPLQFGKQDQGFVSLWLWSHLNKKKLNYIGYGGKGNQVRDIIHIEDVCSLIYKQIKVIKKRHNLLVDIGGGKSNAISLKEHTKKCVKVTQIKIKIDQFYFNKKIF